MGDYDAGPSLTGIFTALQSRISALERTRNPSQYTTAARPNAASAKGAVIFNTTTNKHEGSDGVTWNALY